MGATNVAKVFIHWPGKLTHRELAALAFMANISLDRDDPPVYYGGLQALIDALGLAREGCSPDSASRNVKNVVKGLRNAGCIISSGQARQGIRAEYALALDPETTYIPVGSGRNINWRRVPRSTFEGEQKVHPTSEQIIHPTSEQKVHPPVNESFTLPVNKSFTPRKDLRSNRGIPRNNWDEDNRLSNLSYEGRNSNFGLDDEPENLSPEQERNRQAAALQKLIAQESATAQTR